MTCSTVNPLDNFSRMKFSYSTDPLGISQMQIAKWVISSPFNFSSRLYLLSLIEKDYKNIENVFVSSLREKGVSFLDLERLRRVLKRGCGWVEYRVHKALIGKSLIANDE